MHGIVGNDWLLTSSDNCIWSMVVIACNDETTSMKLLGICGIREALAHVSLSPVKIAPVSGYQGQLCRALSPSPAVPAKCRRNQLRSDSIARKGNHDDDR